MIGKLGDLERRLDRLEKTNPPGRLLVLCQKEGETEEAALVRHHMQPRANDLVIFEQIYGQASCICGPYIAPGGQPHGDT